MAKVNEAVHTREMLPEDESQPSEAEREELLAWLSTQLDDSVDRELEDKMRYPHYGNLVDHDSLSSGEVEDMPYTPARRWLVSPQIFHERVMDVFQLEGRERDHIRQRGLYGGSTLLSCPVNPVCAIMIPDNSVAVICSSC